MRGVGVFAAFRAIPQSAKTKGAFLSDDMVPPREQIIRCRLAIFAGHDT